MDTAQDLKPKPKKMTIVVGIATVLIVTLSVVAVVMLSRPHPPDIGGHDGLVTKSTIPGGFKFPLLPVSKKTLWGDVTILLQEGSNTTKWSPLTTELDNGTASKWNDVTATPNLGALKVNISITDLAGNGYLDGGDYFTLTVGTGQTFSSAKTYTVTVIYVPTGSEMWHLTFTG